MADTNDLIMFGCLIVVVLWIWIFWGHRDRILKLERNNTQMSINLENTDNPEIIRECCSNIKPVNNQKHHLRNYYVMSSYNSCCGGNLNNDYVDFTPLKQVIDSGVRFLDFEIYSKEGVPIIAAKSDDIENGWKSTYNHLNFEETMKFVEKYALRIGSFPKNKSDPLFLNFRVKGHWPNIYDHMNDTLNNVFGSYLLPLNLSNSGRYTSDGLSAIPLDRLKNKVIILCNDIYKGYTNSDFVDTINYNSAFNTYNSGLLKDPFNIKECRKRAKKNLTISHTISNDKQLEFPVHWGSGIQFTCMNFNSYDSYLKAYLQKFNTEGSAFVLKPKHLRYIPLMPKPVKKQKIKNYKIKINNPLN